MSAYAAAAVLADSTLTGLVVVASAEVASVVGVLPISLPPAKKLSMLIMFLRKPQLASEAVLWPKNCYYTFSRSDFSLFSTLAFI